MKLTGVALGIALCACASPTHKETPVMNQSSEPISDEQLVAQLRKAVAASVPPEALEARIGQKALINTATGFPLGALDHVNLVPDPDHPDETLSLDTARVVVYWARPVPGDDPRVVGVQVRKDGAASIFFGLVQPP
jgi:hypothetical protein